MWTVSSSPSFTWGVCGLKPQRRQMKKAVRQAGEGEESLSATYSSASISSPLFSFILYIKTISISIASKPSIHPSIHHLSKPGSPFDVLCPLLKLQPNKPPLLNSVDDGMMGPSWPPSLPLPYYSLWVGLDFFLPAVPFETFVHFCIWALYLMCACCLSAVLEALCMLFPRHPSRAAEGRLASGGWWVGGGVWEGEMGGGHFSPCWPLLEAEEKGEKFPRCMAAAVRIHDPLLGSLTAYLSKLPQEGEEGGNFQLVPSLSTDRGGSEKKQGEAARGRPSLLSTTAKEASYSQLLLPPISLSLYLERENVHVYVCICTWCAVPSSI